MLEFFGIGMLMASVICGVLVVGTIIFWIVSTLWDKAGMMWARGERLNSKKYYLYSLVLYLLCIFITTTAFFTMIAAGCRPPR